MESTKQNLIKILLIINLAISTCAAIGVGYVAYKQNETPNFSNMGQRGNGQMMPGNGRFQSGDNPSDQTQSNQAQ
ncbi:hypothetical protein [Bacillus sp. 165]|uniref:hypothetical protein n=1 Tax=Bacillus sp. 165 TaxID=1529117 RepID=UPI001ADC4003|nr:hypothetical protein [Bacillus sp. 165]MBO9130847.1 hypothetical protein [Bacillus sp. 165]